MDKVYYEGRKTVSNEQTNPIPKNEKIVVAMSGGVDSSVAAALLKEQGYDVVGVTLQIWQEATTETKGGGCCSLGAVEDARRVASRVGIPFYVLNYQQPFAEKVIEPFIASYRRGETPNPCINCNRYIKFDALLQKALSLGATKLATGHYARVLHDEASNRWVLARAGDKSKDQTYALYATKQHELAHMTMPLGGLASKEEPAKSPRKYGLSVANKPDSQEICFVQGENYGQFLAARVPEAVSEGKIVDSSGTIRGKHDGIAFYTVGQRKRVNVGSATPLYVLSVNAETNTVTVGADTELYAPGCVVNDLTWVGMAETDMNQAVPCHVKIRYNMPAVPAQMTRTGTDTLHVHFDHPQRAVSPGQAAVLYGVGEQEDWVLGGGTISGKL